MDLITTEKFVEKLDCEVYPITFIKFLLNKKKILSYFSNAARDDFQVKGIKYEVDFMKCQLCSQKIGMLCRQHTSIQRVLNAETVAFDLDTNVFFYKNEIFKMVDGKLVIVYCPHPKLIVGPITDEKVRKVIPITIEDKDLKELPKYKNVRKFLSTTILDEYMKCWFNPEFNIVTIPNDRNSSNFCLIPNN